MADNQIGSNTRIIENSSINEWILLTISAMYNGRDRRWDPGLFLIDQGVIFENIQDGEPKEKLHECFHTAALKMHYDFEHKTKYVEGFVFNVRLPAFYHGWNIINGQSIDYTHRPQNSDTYFGVVIPDQIVIRAMSNRAKTVESQFGVLGTLAQYKNCSWFLKELNSKKQ